MRGEPDGGKGAPEKNGLADTRYTFSHSTLMLCRNVLAMSFKWPIDMVRHVLLSLLGYLGHDDGTIFKKADRTKVKLYFALRMS